MRKERSVGQIDILPVCDTLMVNDLWLSRTKTTLGRR